MRLGELLRQKGLLTAAQLQIALHEQSRFGGRLGTNLLHLGYVEMDALALALSDQHRLPPVLREHVASVDKKTLALFPARLVLAHKAVPIGYTMTKPGRVVVACVDPATLPLEELAFAAGRRIEPWVAPEALLQECLERYFGVAAAPTRYVAVDLAAREASDASSPSTLAGPVAQPAPATRPKPAPTKNPSRSKRRGLSPPPPPPTELLPAARTLEMPEPALPLAVSVPVAPSGAERRSDPGRPSLEMPAYVPLSESIPVPVVRDLVPDVAAPAPPTLAGLPWWSQDGDGSDNDDWDIPDDPADAPAAEQPLTAPPDALRPFLDLAAASEMLETATTKDQVGDVLADWLRSTFGCGLVLIVKGDMAIGWKGFFPDAEDLVEAVAVPLGKPTMFSAAYESQREFRGPPPQDGAKLQDRLWKLLRCPAPSDALVCAVVLGRRAVNLLYAHMEDGSRIAESAADDASVIARRAAAAYVRMIEKQRA